MKNSPIHILFLVPPNITFEDFSHPPANVATMQLGNGSRNFGSVLTDIPLGVISLSAYLKKHLSIDAQVIDFNIELNREKEFNFKSFKDYFSKKLTKPEIIDFKPDVIAISSLFTSAYQSVVDCADLSKVIFDEPLVLVGGNLPTSMYRDFLNDSPAIDAICYGEGEKPLLDLLNADDLNIFLRTHNSWITRKKMASGMLNPTHDFIEDLDEIPFLDYDILDLEGYHLNSTHGRYAGVKNGVDFLESIRGMAIMTSRGCPFKCTFCASHKAHGRDMRYHSISRVQEDIQKMVEKYGINSLIVQDDHFMGGRDRPYQVVSVIKELGLGIFFQNALAIYALKPDFLRLLKDAGIHELVLPVESGSARVLKDLMHKPLKLDIVKEAVANCREVGIFSDCNIIIGMPGETRQDIDDARAFLKSVFADWFRIFVATPVPGSDMHEACVTNDYFKVSPLKANYKRAVIETEFLTPEEVQEISYLMNIELNFVFNANLRLGNYTTALEGFKNVIKIKPDHAIAFYYAGVCYEKMGNYSEAENYYLEAEKFAINDIFWEKYITEFNIPIYRNNQSLAVGEY